MNVESIKWLDSGFSLRADIWQSLDEIKELLDESKYVHTVGYNVFENDDWVVLIQSVNLPNFDENNDLYRGGYFICKKNIVERKILS